MFTNHRSLREAGLGIAVALAAWAMLFGCVGEQTKSAGESGMAPEQGGNGSPEGGGNANATKVAKKQLTNMFGNRAKAPAMENNEVGGYEGDAADAAAPASAYSTCTTDEECGEPLHCDPSGLCVNADGTIPFPEGAMGGGYCTTDAECGDGFTCLDSTCSQQCQSRAVCGPDMICLESLCTYSMSCLTYDDCTYTWNCIDGLCEPDPNWPDPRLAGEQDCAAGCEKLVNDCGVAGTVAECNEYCMAGDAQTAKCIAEKACAEMCGNCFSCE